MDFSGSTYIFRGSVGCGAFFVSVTPMGVGLLGRFILLAFFIWPYGLSDSIFEGVLLVPILVFSREIWL